MGKSLLILGNGFDLAHGLPTRYSDFLDFSLIVLHLKRFNLVNIDTILEYGNHLSSNSYAQKIVFSEIENLKNNNVFPYIFANKHLEELSQVLLNNVWYSYLEELYINNKFKGENWIDFESEICYIIQLIDKSTKNLSYSYEIVNYEIVNNDELITVEFNDKYKYFHKCIKEYSNLKISIRDLRKLLLYDLKRLTYALKLYLSHFLDFSKCQLRSPDILAINPNYIINFNYTDTYEKLYSQSLNVCHIHGLCEKESSIETNNMVLGIDEYWSDDEKDLHTNFTVFKKFAQRIQKRTSVDFKKIHSILKDDVNLKTISQSFDTINIEDDMPTVYIFGHSLDVTDKDILKLFLNEEMFNVKIFCRDEETEGEYIANVIKIIGEDELIKKVNHYPPKLEFLIQHDMEN